MIKTVGQILTLSVLLLLMGDYAIAERFEKVYSGCFKETSKVKAQKSCLHRCMGTYQEYESYEISTSSHPLCESPNFTCLCTYESKDIELNKKNPE